jgi:hypothetical protein
MEELIKLVSKKTGLPADKAKVAVDTVINYIKKQLPPGIASQLDTMLAGGGSPDNLIQDLGGLLGKKK